MPCRAATGCGGNPTSKPCSGWLPVPTPRGDSSWWRPGTTGNLGDAVSPHTTKGPTMREQRPGIAARAGRWSANHRALAIFGWIAFVIVAAVIGGNVGTKKIKDGDSGSGSSKKADQAIERSFPKDPAGEIILIQARHGSNKSPAFQAVVKDVRTRIKATRNTQKVEQVKLSKDGRSAIVDFELKGDPDKAEDTVDDALVTTAALQRAHPEFRVEEFGGGSAGKALSKRFKDDFK